MMALVAGLACRDALHDRRLFLCFAAALAAVLAPLVVLLGLKEGIVVALRQELVENPRTREVLNIGNRAFDGSWFERIAARGDIAFVVPRTRSIAATVYLERADRAGAPVTAEMAATAPGDPVLGSLAAAAGEDEIVLSDSAARKLGVAAGETVIASATRTVDGRRERAQRPLRIAGVAPAAAFPRDAVFAALDLLLAVEDYGDGRAEGIERARDDPDRVFAGFRLYARKIEDVMPIAAALAAEGVETRTRAEEIAGVLLLDRNLTLIFLIIAGIGTLGYAVSLGASLWANVERKKRDLALIRLIGFSGGSLLAFPVIQAMLIALAGLAAAFAGAGGVAVGVNALYISGLPPGRPLCLLTAADLGAMAGVTLLAAAFASTLAAWRAAAIAPADGIRDE